MENFINQYFKDEKAGALLLAVIGILTILLGVYFLLRSTDISIRGIAYPLLVFGLIQAGIGAGVFFRTDKQVADLQLQIRQAPTTFKQDESARMTKVMRNFRIVKTVEVICILAGVLCILFVGNPRWVGVGIGLLFQTAFLLGFDTIAEQRGDVYFHQIIHMNV